MSTIQDAINAAEAAASTATVTAVPATIDQSSGTVAPAGLGRRITTDDVVGSVFNVQHFIKFSDMGTIIVGAGTKQHEKLKVLLDLSEIQPGWGIRYGNPPVYVRTTDGVTTDKGGNWNDEVARGRRIDPRCQPYNSWQLPFTLLEEADPAKVGERVGYSTVWSSFKAFKECYDKAIAQFGKTAVVELEISCKGVNQPGKKFGQAEFKLVGESVQE